MNKKTFSNSVFVAMVSFFAFSAVAVLAQGDMGGQRPPQGQTGQRGQMPGGQGGNVPGQMGENMNENSQEQPQNGNGAMMMISNEAIEACEDSDEGDECLFTMTRPNDDEETTIEGVCSYRLRRNDDEDDDDTLVCMSEDMGMGENGNLERVKQMKQERVKEIARIESRIEKVIDFLESEDVDVDEMEGYFETLQEKADTLLAAYDDYIDLLEDDDASDDDLEEAREVVRTAGEDFKTYFSETLRVSIQDALDELKN